MSKLISKSNLSGIRGGAKLHKRYDLIVLDDFEDEIDYDPSPDKLLVIFEATGEKIVINTQRAIKEIWLAGNSRAWHFQFQQEKNIWFANAEQEEFYQRFLQLL